MSVCVELVDDVACRPESSFTISPELALVDPDLAAIARVRLREPGVALRLTRADAPTSEDASKRAIAVLAAAAAASDDLEAPERRRSWRLPASVAAVTMLTLLFLDVRIQVGENPASAETSAVDRGPTNSAPAQPAVPTPATRTSSKTGGFTRGSRAKNVRERRFAWAPVPRASRYEVEFYRGQRRILAAKTSQPLLTVPPTWRIGGAEESLRPGAYRWYVWPVISGRRASGAVVQATISIPPS